MFPDYTAGSSAPGPQYFRVLAGWRKSQKAICNGSARRRSPWPSEANPPTVGRATLVSAPNHADRSHVPPLLPQGSPILEKSPKVRWDARESGQLLSNAISRGTAAPGPREVGLPGWCGCKPRQGERSPLHYPVVQMEEIPVFPRLHGLSAHGGRYE